MLVLVLIHASVYLAGFLITKTNIEIGALEKAMTLLTNKEQESIIFIYINEQIESYNNNNIIAQPFTV